MSEDKYYPTLKIERSHEAGGYQGFTTVLVTGDWREVKSYCTEYCKAWHPAGYGTSVRLYKEHDDGRVTYRIWRSNTCD